LFVRRRTTKSMPDAFEGGSAFSDYVDRVPVQVVE